MWAPFILLNNCSEAGALLPLQIRSISRAAQHNTIKLLLHLLSELIQCIKVDYENIFKLFVYSPEPMASFQWLNRIRAKEGHKDQIVWKLFIKIRFRNLCANKILQYEKIDKSGVTGWHCDRKGLRKHYLLGAFSSTCTPEGRSENH